SAEILVARSPELGLPYCRTHIEKDGQMNHGMRIAAAATVASILGALPALGARQATGTKQQAETRLRAAERSPAGSAIDEVLKTIFATHRFEQAAISPDGKRVAWVEEVISKNGLATGKTVMYVADLDSSAKPHRVSAEVADAIGAEGSVAWSRDSKQ